MFHPSFVGIRELDQEILLNLDDKSLARACQIDKWTQSLCANPLFWRERTLRKYGSQILGYKPLGETYSQQYQRLRRAQDLWDKYHSTTENPQIDEMMVLMKQGIKIDPRAIDYVATNGNTETLDWLFTQGVRPSISTLRNALFRDQVENFEWVHQHGVQFDRHVADNAAANGAVKIVEYLFQNYNLVPRYIDFSSLVGKGYLEILIWLDRHGLGLPSQEDTDFVKTIINYIDQKIYFSMGDDEEELMDVYI